ncbi:three-Cys-motif partner protein TcmP [bacterium]|nr:three-Cys-motif partner protein TcmP [bacterium]
MPLPDETVWPLDLHTQAKHDILRRYLGAWFPILNTWHRKIVYIDSFCGPGRYKGGEAGSPLIALDAAANHRRELQGELDFLFIDERQDRIENLRGELDTLPYPEHFTVRTKHGLFHEQVEPLLGEIEAHTDTVPAFVFIDPFGFKGIPFTLVRRLLLRERCEVLITFMVDAINRWLTHPNEQVNAHILDAFGTDEAAYIAGQVGDRTLALRSLYQRQLALSARFVRFFEMKDCDDRPQYYLFFATNHPKGHVKMKEAMWKVDPSGRFSFSDATDPDQIVLFADPDLSLLERMLLGHFKGQSNVLGGKVRIYVEDETAFIYKHKTKALKQLEGSDTINVSDTKADDTRRKAGTYPDDVLINFPS